MRLSALLLALVVCAGARAQGQNNYGSIYSLYGLGERVEFGSSQSVALGHAATALRSGTYVNLSNPALWSDQALTTFSAGASLATVRGEDALTDEASVGTAGDLSSLHLGVPLLPGRLGVTLAYRPFSRVNYRAAIRDSLSVEGDMAPYTLNQEGAGGLQQLSAGVGAKVGSFLQLGASADVLFGSQELLQRTDFDDNVFLETRQARVTRLRGITATLGAAVTARNLATDDDALTVAASVRLPAALDASRTVTLGESLDRDTLRAPDGSLSVDGDVTIPLAVRGGVAYLSGLRWLAALDASYEPWSGFDSSLPVGGYDPGTGLDLLSDRVRVGGGFEITPAGRDRRAGVFQRSSYRIGGYAENGLYAPAGEDVTTLALTGGVSVPNRLTGARFDLGLEVGTRGSAEGVLVRDTFFKGTLTLNFGERWFVRRRFD
ncbi:hypothetical protein [Rubrivirga marina]|uniref:hypothetical protein n=1 Tax=Rubrivirga marina TaxID=1196024 RepID=UPI000BA90697|nr:hypothetical protein [Rubrivirga marina]